MAVINRLVDPLNSFAWNINGLLQAWVSVKRIEEYLQLPNIDIGEYYTPTTLALPETMPTTDNQTILQLDKASFSWKAKSEETTAEVSFLFFYIHS